MIWIDFETRSECGELQCTDLQGNERRRKATRIAHHGGPSGSFGPIASQRTEAHGNER